VLARRQNGDSEPLSVSLCS